MTKSYIRYIRYPVEITLLWFALAIILSIFMDARGMTYDLADEGNIDLCLLALAVITRVLLSDFRDLMQGDVKR